MVGQIRKDVIIRYRDDRPLLLRPFIVRLENSKIGFHTALQIPSNMGTRCRHVLAHVGGVLAATFVRSFGHTFVFFAKNIYPCSHPSSPVPDICVSAMLTAVSGRLILTYCIRTSNCRMRWHRLHRNPRQRQASQRKAQNARSIYSNTTSPNQEHPSLHLNCLLARLVHT